MDTFRHENQPYGTVIFTLESIKMIPQDSERKAGWYHLEGKVVKGSITSRMFQHKSTRDITGEDYTLTVSPRDFERGFRISVAM